MLRADLIPQQFKNSIPNTVMGWTVAGAPTNIGVFTPATALLDGSIGLIPKPLAGQQDYILSNNGWIVAPSGGGGGGNPPGGALTEMQINAGPTSFGGGRIFVPTNGNLVLGDGVLAGDRTISVASSNTNASLILQFKGTGGWLRIRQDGFDRAVFGSNGGGIITSGIFSISDTTDNDGLRYDTTTNILSYEASALAGPTPFIISGGGGTSANNNGGSTTLRAGSAHALAGNGNGGSITIQSGQRRVSGTGVDGNITFDALGGYINLAGAAFRLNGVLAGDPSTMFFGADGSWKVPAGTGLTVAGADTEIQIKNGSALGVGKVFIPANGDLAMGDDALTGVLRNFTAKGSSVNVAFSFLGKASSNQRSVVIGSPNNAPVTGSTDLGDILIGADVSGGAERTISAGTQIGSSADLALRSSGTSGMINLRGNAIGIYSRAGTSFGSIFIAIGAGTGEDVYQQNSTISANRPLSFRSCNGDISINNGRSIMIVAGSALGSSGNGAGGAVVIQSGQRRVAGTGQDGAISIDSRTAQTLISGGGISLYAPAGIVGMTGASVEAVTNSYIIRGASNPLVVIGDSGNTSSRLKSNDGSLGVNSGAALNINGGNAYNASGNGNGGNIVITSGQRRTSGSGVDGNIYIDTLTGYLIISVIPTSSAGLPSGAVWANSNALMRVP